MNKNEIDMIDTTIDIIYNAILQLKTLVGECKGQMSASELNKKEN